MFDKHSEQETMIKSLKLFVHWGVTGMLILFGPSRASTPKEKPLNLSGFLLDYLGFRPSPDESGSWTVPKQVERIFGDIEKK